MESDKVIAIDIDPEKIRQAKNNAKVYGVSHKIEFICADFFLYLSKLENVDAVFLSPPWGGPSYNQNTYYSLDQIEPINGFDLFSIARQITKNVVFFLPRNTNIQDLCQLPALATGEEFQIEKNYINNKLKTITVYFGELSIVEGFTVEA
jgi:trimethylguanosine synthase